MLSSHIAVQRNAFSTAINGAKICDGKVTSSIGVRFATSTTIDAAGGHIWIALIPSLNCAYQFTKSTLVKDATDPSKVTEEIVQDSTDHDDLCYLCEESKSKKAVQTSTQTTQNSSAGTNTTVTTTTVPTTTQDVYSDKEDFNILKTPHLPEKWRLVSSAMRISCINNSENNNGYFEAIRQSYSYEQANSGLLYCGATENGALGMLSRGINVQPTFNASKEWVNDSSYVTGKLRDLYKHNFHLKTTGPRDFHASGDEATWYKENTSTEKFSRAYCNSDPNSGMDTNFDVIFVKISAASVKLPEDANRLTVHVHTVKNMEFVFGPTEPMARYQTPTLAFPRLVEETDRLIKRDLRASNIRSASNIPYNVRGR